MHHEEYSPLVRVQKALKGENYYMEETRCLLVKKKNPKLSVKYKML